MIRPNPCNKCNKVPSFIEDSDGHYVKCICGERTIHMKTRKESILMWNNSCGKIRGGSDDNTEHNW